MNPSEIFKFSRQCFGKSSDEKIKNCNIWKFLVVLRVHRPYRDIIPPFLNHPPPIIRIPSYFVKSPIHPFYWQISLPKFSSLPEMQLKLSSINIIHAKHQHNVGFFIWKFIVKFMPGNVYVNKIHARQCLYMISLYCREDFPHSFNFFVFSKGMLQV